MLQKLILLFGGEVCRNMLGACLTFLWHFAVSSRPEDQGEAIASRLSESDPRVGG